MKDQVEPETIRDKENLDLHSQEYRYIMANSCRQYKQMPGGMCIRIFIPQIKKYAYGI